MEYQQLIYIGICTEYGSVCPITRERNLQKQSLVQCEKSRLLRASEIDIDV